jgi:hypothetical protein
MKPGVGVARLGLLLAAAGFAACSGRGGPAPSLPVAGPGSPGSATTDLPNRASTVASPALENFTAPAPASSSRSSSGPSSSSVSVVPTAGLRPFQKEALDVFDADMKNPRETLNKACGATISLTRDFSAYNAEEWAGQSVSSRCEAVLVGIQTVCERPHYRPEVVKLIGEVKCLFGGKPGADSSETAANISFAGRALVFKMHKDNSNISDITGDVLKRKIDGQ